MKMSIEVLNEILLIATIALLFAFCVTSLLFSGVMAATIASYFGIGLLVSFAGFVVSCLYGK